MPGIGKRCSASHCAYSSRILKADCEMKPRPTPFKIWSQLKHFGHSFQRSTVTFPWHNTFVLVLHSCFAYLKLPKQHDDGMEQIKWLKSEVTTGLPSFLAIHS